MPKGKYPKLRSYQNGSSAIPNKETVMTRQQIEDRIKNLETEREQMRSTLVAYEGAIQDCKYWLAQLEKSVDDEDNAK